MSTKTRNLIICIALFLVFLTACFDQTPVPPSQIPTSLTTPTDAITKLPTSYSIATTVTMVDTPTQPVVETFQPYETPEITQSPLNTPTQYRLKVEFDYARHKLAVEEHIIFTNNYAEPLADITLMIEPLRYPDTFQWVRLSWDDGTPIENYDLYPGRLVIPLSTALSQDENLSLQIAYNLNLPRLQADAAYRGLGPFGYTELQTNLTDWYPFIPPYIPDKGWIAHEPGSYGEHLVYEIADFEVEIHPVGTLTNVVIAASGAGYHEDNIYTYQSKAARNFTWSASPYYRTKSNQVGDVMVYSYYFPEHWVAGRRVLTTTVEALELFSQLFGSYPHSTMTAVEADFEDGMEYDGLYFLGAHYYAAQNRKTADYLVAVAAHETAHQWWYGKVGNDQALEPWLDEALCTYSESLYYEFLYPADLAWWWTYRVQYYQPEGPIDITIYDVQGRHNYLEYRDPVYLHGAMFFDQLRSFIGEDPFFQFLKEYARINHHRLVSQTDFFRSLSRFTTRDISELTERFFTSPFSLQNP